MATLTELRVSTVVAPNGYDNVADDQLNDDSDGTFIGDSSNDGGTNNYDQGNTLDNVDSDFGNMDTCSCLLRHAWATTPDPNLTWGTLGARIMNGATVLAAADSGGAFEAIASSISASSPTDSSDVGFTYVNTSATKAQWDGGVLETRITTTRIKGGATIERRIHEAKINGTYTLGSVAYDLNAEPGSYAITGAADGDVVGRVLDAGPGALAVTGAPTTNPVSYVLNAEPGSYLVTGADATLTVIVAGGTAYEVNAEPGSYAITGAAATLPISRAFDAQGGVYAITGAVVGLPIDRAAFAAPGSYTITGAAMSTTVGQLSYIDPIVLPDIYLYRELDPLSAPTSRHGVREPVFGEQLLDTVSPEEL